MSDDSIFPDGWEDVFPSRDEFQALSTDFLIGVIIIGISLCLLTLLMIILYCWLYAVEQKIKRIQGNRQTDFTIRRAQINNDTKSSAGQNPTAQNPLSRSNNFSAVVDDLKRTSSVQPNVQSRYPNYVNDNNNFSF